MCHDAIAYFVFILPDMHCKTLIAFNYTLFQNQNLLKLQNHL
jgi:hypothetical protein